MRRIAGDYNADRKDLFTRPSWGELSSQVRLSDADRFVLDQLHADLEALRRAAQDLAKRLKEFAGQAPHRERPRRGPSCDDPRGRPGDDRRGGQRAGRREAVPQRQGGVRLRRAGAGGAAERRQGAKDLGITKEGSPLLRWALVEAAWRVVRTSAAWRRIYERIEEACGGKKAIVAVARRLLCVMYAMLRTTTPYKVLAT